MKSTFLAAAVVGGIGVSKVVLRDVNGGEGLNDFRAGSQRGDLPLDFYGDGPKPEPGKTYVLTLEEYVEPAETDETSSTEINDTALKTQPAPLSIAFNAMVTIAVDENGNPSLNIDPTTSEVAPSAETEDTTDTHDTSNLPDNGAEPDTATDSGNGNDAAGDQSNGTGSLSESNNESTINNGDTNTQGNTGPAAGANDSKAGATDAANTDNLADKGTGPVGGEA